VTARTRRRFWFACIIIWLGPGAALSWFLRESVAWVNLQSWLALVVAFASCWAAETPVEKEDS
jgi:hypothetical protein